MAGIIANLTVRSDGRNSNEIWLLMCHSLFEVSESIFSNLVGAVLAMVNLDFVWVVPVSLDMLKGGIIVLIRVSAH